MSVLRDGAAPSGPGPPEGHPRSTSSGGIPERVAQLYYRHGLFCSSHPVPVIALAAIIVLACCYPLLNIPLPGNAPQEFSMSAVNFTVPVNVSGELLGDGSPFPRWFRGPPFVYILQIVVTSAVSPWRTDLKVTDGFRAPLDEVFRLVETINNFQDGLRGTSLSHLCLHVEEPKTRSAVLPRYNCLVLSPANLWQDLSSFRSDASLVSTIYSHQDIQKGKISLTELLFGMNLQETGLKRFPIRARQRVLQYAVTVALKQLDQEYVDGLRRHLMSRYLPRLVMNESSGNGIHDIIDDHLKIVHIQYPSHFNVLEFIPLTVTYFILFLYIYFSVRKIELVKSKIGMAFSAVMTVVASLCMSVGLCFFFGLTFTLNGKEIFPYLVVIVGLENILVLTKSVVSTPTHLDVKIRVAQGLSKEGWSITKNLLTEVTILTIGFFTFVPAIQEFCIFAVVGLLCDFFLQMVFFLTVLSIDIHRMELAERHYGYRHSGGRSISPNLTQNMRTASQQSGLVYRAPSSGSRLTQSNSHPRLNGMAPSAYPANVVAPSVNSPVLVKLPKRLRLVYFFARMRFFQRAFMVCMVVWISLIVYNSGIVEHFINMNSGPSVGEEIPIDSSTVTMLTSGKNSSSASGTTFATTASNVFSNHSTSTFHSVLVDKNGEGNSDENGESGLGRDVVNNLGPTLADIEIESSKLSNNQLDIEKLRQRSQEPWHLVSNYHWPAVFSMYNMSLAGHYISILPPIFLSIPISPEVAVDVRNPNEKAPAVQWQGLAAAALDHLDFSDGEITGTPPNANRGGGPYVPSSPMELFLTAVLCVTSVIFLAYVMVVFYQCVCTRNYAEWRASWAGDPDAASTHDAYTQVVLEAIPMVLEGHQGEVECIASDGGLVLSYCLAGLLCVWDGASGDLITTIDRQAYLQAPVSQIDAEVLEDLLMSGYESSSPPSSGEPDQMMIRSPVLPFNHRQRKCRVSIASDSDMCEFNQPSASTVYSDPAIDYRQLINTNFTALSGNVRKVSMNDSNVYNRKEGYDFGAFVQSNEPVVKTEISINCTPADNRISALPLNDQNNFHCEISDVKETYRDVEQNRPRGPRRNFSMESVTSDSGCHGEGSVGRPISCSPQSLTHPHNSPTNNDLSGLLPSATSRPQTAPPVWCIDCVDGLIALGCSNGRTEFWEATSGKFKCFYEDGTGIGVTHIRLVGNRVIGARLSGALEFLELVSYRRGKQVDWGFTSYRRTHVRTGSAGSSSDWDKIISWDDDIRSIWRNTIRAHQQPITVLETEGGRVLSGSQDHTLKVFRLEDHLALYTLHGHCGPITALFIDKMSPMTSGSGSQDGMLCVWDLLTGACMYSIQAHDGSISALTYSVSYIISLGSDEKLCVWERFQGHLLSTVQLESTFCSNVSMITHNLLITSKQGSLIVWDARTGETVHIVKLGHDDGSVFVKQMIFVGDSVICDYGRQLRIIRFPMVTEKCD